MAEKKQRVLRADVETFDAWDAAASKAGLSFNAWAANVLDQASDGSASVPDPPPASEPRRLRAPRAMSEPGTRRAPTTESEPATPEVAAPASQVKRSYQPDWKPEKREKKRRG